jgi:hypothetical protein
MMLTMPNPRLRQRLLDELLAEDGEVDWQRLEDLAALAAHDTAFHLDTEGLAEPALDMLLSPEGAALRRALIAELLNDPGAAAVRVDQLSPLLTSDRSLSGRTILDKLVPFLLSPAGQETRSQLAAGLRSRNNGLGHLDLARLVELTSLAGRLHPELRTGTLVSVVASYLLSAEGKPIRTQILTAGAQCAVTGIGAMLSRLAQPLSPPTPVRQLAQSE